MVDTASKSQDRPDLPGTSAAGEPAHSPWNAATSLVRIARPRQWIKNLLVFAAPGAAGVLTHWHSLLLACGAFGIFCLAASGTYFVNDAVDAEADRHHPLKRRRPVAAGVVSVRLAVSTGFVLMAAAFGLAWAMAGWQFALVIGIYVAIATAYSLRLKHEPIIDLACVSAGFVLRAIAGGVATGVPLSDWFVIVASFGSLLVVTGKRSAEQAEHGQGIHRPILEEYPPAFLRSVRLLSAAVTVTAYCLWAFERSARAVGRHHHPIWFQLSIIPVVLALLHLELRFERGQGAAPEDLALHDHLLQGLGLAWVVLFAVGVYA
ncbi:MAG TPA: decaprenyl-phosphate phosphoribosyltransferase [Acidimicrobiales bacterium]|nr:decaprenyl-phosphate phosphoribosyltransferase [Acidimicrobiales bacterium]